MEPVKHDSIPWGVPGEDLKSAKILNPLFPFMGIGSLIYAFFYTLFLYKNASGITYPFFVGGTCLFFFLYLKRSGTAVKGFSIFITVSLILLGFSTCCTDSWVLILFNKTGIFLLFFYLVLHSLYEDKKWDISKYLGAIANVVFTSVGFIFRPFTDLVNFLEIRKKEKVGKSEGKGKYILFGLLIAVPLLFVIGLLLCSADIVFLNIFDTLFSDIFTWKWGGDIWGVTGLFIFAFFASYCILCKLAEHNIREEVQDRRTAEPLVGITFTGLISLVYLLFSAIQIIYLFAGLGSLPEGYTYARYAREGFFQLVFVCLINLVLVLTCVKYFRENRLLKGILTFISLCTYIMITSSAYKMLLYIQVYHLTFLRVFVLWALFVIFLLMTGTIISIYQSEFPLVKYCILVVTVLYLIFSFAHPDYWIARYNLDHIYTEEITKNGEVSYSINENRDFYYLKHLSMDAAPAIYSKASEIVNTLNCEPVNDHEWDLNWWLEDYSADLLCSSYNGKIGFPLEDYHYPKKMSIRKFNFSRWTAYLYYTVYYDEHPAFADRVNGNIYLG